MNGNFFKAVKSTVNYWYVPLLVGILFIGLGIWTYATPEASFQNLAWWFSLSFLLSGLFEIFFATSNRNELDNWGWTLVFGIINFLVGLNMMMKDEVGMLVLALYVGFIILFRSIMGISTAIEMKNYGVKSWTTMLAFGILGTIFGFILLWNPAFAGMSVVIWVALAFIMIGIFGILLSLKLKKIHDMPNKISDELKERYHAIQDEIRQELS